MEPVKTKRKFSLKYALTRAERSLGIGSEDCLEWRDVEAIEFAIYKIMKLAGQRQNWKSEVSGELGALSLRDEFRKS